MRLAISLIALLVACVTVRCETSYGGSAFSSGLKLKSSMYDSPSINSELEVESKEAGYDDDEVTESEVATTAYSKNEKVYKKYQPAYVYSKYVRPTYKKYRPMDPVRPVYKSKSVIAVDDSYRSSGYKDQSSKSYDSSSNSGKTISVKPVTD